MSCKQLEKVNGTQGLIGSGAILSTPTPLDPFSPFPKPSKALSDIDTVSEDKCVGRLTGLSAKRLRNALSRIIKRNLKRVVCIYMARVDCYLKFDAWKRFGPAH